MRFSVLFLENILFDSFQSGNFQIIRLSTKQNRKGKKYIYFFNGL